MKQIILTILIFFVVLSGSSTIKAEAFDEHKRILIINSYHDGDEWEDDIQAGIKEQMKELSLNAEVYKEYMDSRRFHNEFLQQQFFDYCKDKYKNIKFDAIISTDNSAFDFLKAYHNQLFKNVPIVFCGINDFKEEAIANETLFTGVTETIDIDKNIEIAKKFHGDAKNFYFIVNPAKVKTLSNMPVFKKESKYANIKIHYLYSNNFENLLRTIRRLPKDSVIFIFSTFKDNQTGYISMTDAADKISSTTDLPLYSFWSYYIKHGIVGGVLADGELQGKSAVNLLNEVLRGTPPAAISVIKNNNFKELYDYRKLEKYNIDRNMVPSNSIVIDRMPMVYTVTKKLVFFSTYVVITILAIIIFLLHKNVIKTKEVEKNLKEREEQLLTLINSLPDIICFKDNKGRWLEVNNAGIEAYSLEDVDYMRKTDAEISAIMPELAGIFDPCDEEVCEEGNTVVTEKKITFKDKNKVYSFTKVPVFNPDGSKKGELVLGKDVTEKKKAEEDRKKLDQALEYDKLKTEFFANISHEFRTPLNVLFTTTQLFELYLKNGSIVDNGVNVNKKIYILKQNCFRLLRLVNNLIDITKIDSGYLSLNLVNRNIVSIIEDITLSVADYIEAKGINIIFDTDVEEKIVALDADKIERILLNLLSNAIKFTPPGGDIEVNIYDNDEKVIISVKDTGLGIDKEHQELVFQRFRQVDKSLTRANEGSGIGLSLVKSLVEMHGGTIAVISEYGKGSEFIIELPAIELEDEEQEEQAIEYNYIERINIEFSDIYS